MDDACYLSIAVKSPDPPKADTSGGVIGADRGLVELLTDSQGQSFSGSAVKAVRGRVREHRRQVQRKRSRSAFKRLQKVRRRASRFMRDVNHCISKSLVQKALALKKALSLEDLSGIGERASGFHRAMRRRMGHWAFADLAAKVVYKAADVGLAVVFVDPRNTSRICSSCGHCARANRKSQSSFECLSCGLCMNADRNGALTIKARGAQSAALMFRPTAAAHG